MLNVSLG